MPREEDAAAEAFLRIAGHVGECDECGGRPVPAVLDAQGRASMPVLDLSDPGTKLCLEGARLRTHAAMTRAALPAERLIRAYGLEQPDVPPADEHDCKRAIVWLREDPGRARSIMEVREARAGFPIEEEETPTAELRQAFLAGFRRVNPSRGALLTADELANRQRAADRIVDLIADRYARRFGAPPPAAALAEFRREHDLWIKEAGDLGVMADHAAKFAREHPVRWNAPSMLPAKDPVDELKKIARWISESLIQAQSQKG